ncbi:MAG TPA: DUF1573 domain-containing protein [Planctomycetaceae bacterium]|nr:DUF1573 domain-containing protein [Planctomycetaceae bacterium]
MAAALAVLAASLAGPPAASAQGWAEKMFDKLTHDFGVVARGAEVKHRIRIRNIYSQTVHISNVRTTCGCSAATPDQTTLAPGETASVEIEMDTRRFMRRKDSNLIVTFDQPRYAEVRIPVTTYIRSDVVLSPGSAGFGNVDAGSQAVKTLDIDYAGRSDWKLRDVKVDNAHLDARVVETRREAGRVSYQLTLTLKPTAPVGALAEQITLVTDDENPNIPVLVSARVEADITITPDAVSLGTVAPGQEKTFNVVVRGRKPFAIEKIECESADGAFKVRLPAVERPVHVLPMSFTPPTAPGKFTEEFTVTIAGRSEPLTFRAYGQILESRVQ